MYNVSVVKENNKKYFCSCETLALQGVQKRFDFEYLYLYPYRN